MVSIVKCDDVGNTDGVPPKKRIERLPNYSAVARRRGRSQALCLVAVMRAHRAPFMLGHAVKKMIQQGQFEGEQVAFCQTIGEACL